MKHIKKLWYKYGLLILLAVIGLGAYLLIKKNPAAAELPAETKAPADLTFVPGAKSGMGGSITGL